MFSFLFFRWFIVCYGPFIVYQTTKSHEHHPILVVFTGFRRLLQCCLTHFLMIVIL